MEKALFISRFADLRFSGYGYSRIYFGSEFCEGLIPAAQEIKEVLDFAAGKKLKLTFVTCYCTDRGIKKIEEAFEMLSAYKHIDALEPEAVFNDFGVLMSLRRYRLRPVMGRLLTRQSRDPRIKDFPGKYPEKKWRHLKECAFAEQYCEDFFKQHNISRVEIDNLLQGIHIPERQTGDLKVSLYFPFGYVTTGRSCPSTAEQYPLSCQKPCLSYSLARLSYHSMPAPLYLKGNTVFFRNSRLPQFSDYKMIDRLVWQPGL